MKSKFKSFIKEWWTVIALWSMVVIGGIFCIVIMYTGHQQYEIEQQQYQQWFNTLTPEQQKAERIKQDQRRYSRYDVISVTRYYKTNTNQWGGVTSSELCYAFVYIDGNGNAQHVEDFIHAPYGIMKVALGDSNKYIIDKIHSISYLQLTKETFQELK